MVKSGIKYGKLPGDWFGPSTVCLILRDLTSDLTIEKEKCSNLSVMVTQGDIVYISEVNKLCCQTQSSASAYQVTPNHNNSHNVQPEDFIDSPLRNRAPRSKDKFYDPLMHLPPESTLLWKTSLVIFIPLLLGVNGVNKEYIEVGTAITNYLCFYSSLTLTDISLIFVGKVTQNDST